MPIKDRSQGLPQEIEVINFVSDVINKKPIVIVANTVGQIFRSNEELLDTKDFLCKQFPNPLMYGVCGGRLSYNTPYREISRIARDLGIEENDEILKNLPERFSDTKKFYENLRNAGIRHNLEYWFDCVVQDLDICVVPKSVDIVNTSFVERGRRSDVKIDIHIVSARTVFDQNNEFYSGIFDQSVRICF